MYRKKSQKLEKLCFSYSDMTTKLQENQIVIGTLLKKLYQSNDYYVHRDNSVKFSKQKKNPCPHNSFLSRLT